MLCDVPLFISQHTDATNKNNVFLCATGEAETAARDKKYAQMQQYVRQLDNDNYSKQSARYDEESKYGGGK